MESPVTRPDIERLIPHRAPFVFIDAVTALDAGQRACSTLTLRGDEAFLAGHFPGEPLMPGVLILEHMAQTAGVLVASAGEERARLRVGGFDRARFLRPVRPGETLSTEVTAVKLFATMGLCDAVSHVDGELAARARLSLAAPEPARDPRG